jgi:hypothetical protein
MPARLIYRRLTPTEWSRLLPACADIPDAVPDPRDSIVIIAETPDGALVGFITCQLLAHFEPLWVERSWRGHVSLPHLFNALHKCIPHLTRAVATCESSRMVPLIQRAGMRLLGLRHCFAWQAGMEGRKEGRMELHKERSRG